ncbi:LytR/AlgR family response regulator transcription factor [Flavihumibacter solisilvae]|uniref:LytR/AlgR family response regulator transcription factor n=1 Tax=Flavihumibacter solisilvae TaxID=1349421 RepID=UPI000689B02F|nr:LytTR family DNA-binding domain-containing protein [Flavihumibacter solisilvae]
MEFPVSGNSFVVADAGINNYVGKRSFLVHKRNKYYTVPTDQVAYFYISHEIPVLVTYDRQEYFVNYSLESLQQMLTGRQFYRLNRQYLVSFNAIKEIEHYFARKLLVALTIPTKEKLLVSKEKASSFLKWLENR